MTDELPYKDGAALWAAVTARAKTGAPTSGVAAGEMRLVPAVPPTRVRLYPVVDHIADMLCATQST